MPALLPHMSQPLLTQSEISELYVAISIQKDVVWLQIPMDDALLMEVFKSKHQVCQIVSGP